MASATVMSPQNEPRKVVREKLQEFTSTLIPIPPTLRIGEKLVSIADLVRSLKRFRIQKLVLEKADLRWPSIELSAATDDQVHQVPLDLMTTSTDATELTETTLAEFLADFQQSTAATRALMAGFKVGDASPQEMNRSFMALVSDIITKRLFASLDPNNGPPTEPFEVTTNSNHIEILFADGHFVSTQQGFGFSTPASRQLPWGNYIFGSKSSSGKVQFSNTLWRVPDTTSIHLSV